MITTEILTNSLTAAARLQNICPRHPPRSISQRVLNVDCEGVMCYDVLWCGGERGMSGVSFKGTDVDECLCARCPALGGPSMSSCHISNVTRLILHKHEKFPVWVTKFIWIYSELTEKVLLVFVCKQWLGSNHQFTWKTAILIMASSRQHTKEDDGSILASAGAGRLDNEIDHGTVIKMCVSLQRDSGHETSPGRRHF